MQIKTVLNQDFENLPPEEEKTVQPKITFKKPLIIFVSIFGSVLVLLTITAIFMGFKPKNGSENQISQPTATPTPEFKEEITNPSPYATDSGILKIEKEIKSLDEKIQKTDLEENDLNPPLLDWKVNFEEK